MDEISPVLAATARRWLDLTAEVPDDLLLRPAVADEWSAADCLRHLVQVDRHVFPQWLDQFLAGAEELAPLDPSSIPPVSEQTPRELAEAFASAREKNVERLATLRPEDLERTSRSPRFGPLTLALVVRQWALHDLQHQMQAERALFQALLVDSGPLRVMFAADDLEATRVEA